MTKTTATVSGYTFKLFQENGEPCNNGELAAILSLEGKEPTTLLQFPEIKEFKRFLRLFTHLANGDFKGYEIGNHMVLNTPRISVTVPTGWQVANIPTTPTYQDLRLNRNGHYVEYRNGKSFAAIPEIQDIYHQRVDIVLRGERLAVVVPRGKNDSLRNEYIRSVLDSLEKGEGLAWAAMEDKIDDAREEREAAKLAYLLDTTGELAAANADSVRVRTVDNTVINANTLPDGTKFEIWTEGGVYLPGIDIEWHPGQPGNEIAVGALRNIKVNRVKVILPNAG